MICTYGKCGNPKAGVMNTDMNKDNRGNRTGCSGCATDDSYERNADPNGGTSPNGSVSQ